MSDLIVNFGTITVYQDGSTMELADINIGLGLRYADTAFVNNPLLTKIDEQCQYSPNVINIVAEQEFQEPFNNQSSHSKLQELFGGVFCDDNDELILGYGYSSPRGFAAATHFNRSNDVSGICLGIFEPNSLNIDGITVMSWGNMNSSLFVHEYLHTYAGHCRDLGLSLIHI